MGRGEERERVAEGRGERREGEGGRERERERRGSRRGRERGAEGRGREEREGRGKERGQSRSVTGRPCSFVSTVLSQGSTCTASVVEDEQHTEPTGP